MEEGGRDAADRSACALESIRVAALLHRGYALSTVILSPSGTRFRTVASPSMLPMTLTALAARISFPLLAGVRPKNQAQRRAGRPIRNRPHLDHRAGARLLLSGDRDTKVDLVSPGAGGSIEGQRLPDRVRRGRVDQLRRHLDGAGRDGYSPAVHRASHYPRTPLHAQPDIRRRDCSATVLKVKRSDRRVPGCWRAQRARESAA